MCFTMNFSRRFFKKNSPVFFILALAVSFPAHAQIAGPGNDAYQKAQAFVSEGDLESAEESFREALTVEPMNAEYHFELANLYAQQHDESESVGDSLGAERKMQQAADELERAVMVKPDFLPARFNLGVVYKKLGKFEQARKEFQEVLRMDASQVGARMQIASTYEAQGFYDEAETIYKEVRDQYPQNLDVADALNGLDERRVMVSQREGQARMMRMNTLAGGLSSLSGAGTANRSPWASQSQPGYGYDSASYGSGSGPGYGYQNNSQTAQPSSLMGQAIPYLGQWALQQFMRNKDSHEQ